MLTPNPQILHRKLTEMTGGLVIQLAQAETRIEMLEADILELRQQLERSQTRDQTQAEADRGSGDRTSWPRPAETAPAASA